MWDIESKVDLDEYLKKVLKFATNKHKGQFRDDGTPYIEHPKRVCVIVDEVKAQYSKNRDILLASALLHDTLEDTYTSYRELNEIFGEEVASLVEEVTTASYVPKLKGKAQYLADKMVHMSSYALIIKLADRLDNLNDLSGCSIEKIRRTVSDTEFIIDNVEKRYDGLTLAHYNLMQAIKDRIKELYLLYNLNDHTI